MLELFHNRWTDGLGRVGLYLAILGLGALSQPVILTSWWLWALIIGMSALAFRKAVTDYRAAGADWFQTGSQWVDTYDLVKIKVTVSTVTWHVHLTDRGERHLVVSVLDLQANPELWDLVYNGIRHSAAAGAEVRGSGARQLRLDSPPGETSVSRLPTSHRRRRRGRGSG